MSTQNSPRAGMNEQTHVGKEIHRQKEKHIEKEGKFRPILFLPSFALAFACGLLDLRLCPSPLSSCLQGIAFLYSADACLFFLWMTDVVSLFSW